MKKLAILLLLILSVSSKAQNIKGLVINLKDFAPVEFANVALLQLPDSSIINGSITLTGGYYNFDNVKPGNYYVKASFMGLATNGTNVKVNASGGEVIADTIFLQETTQSLEEVTVTGQRLKGKELVDRTVYEVPEVVAKASSNGYDILKKIPQVQVDFQNNVTLNGTTNFIIQVDGKQRDKEYLAKLLPSDIQSIEIISNPSGKYEGNIDGVINIILKREARFGLSGSASAFVKPINKPTGIVSGTLEYGMGNISFYVTAFSFVQQLSIKSNLYESFLNTDSNYMSGLGDLEVGSTSVNTGFDYYLNDFNTLSLNFNYKPVNQKNDMGNFNEYYRNDTLQNLRNSITKTQMGSDEGSVSLFYKKTFKKAVQEFTSETNYYLFKSKDNKDYLYSVFAPVTESLINTFDQIEENLNNRSYFSTKLNYVHPFGLTTKLEVGYQLYFQNMDYDLTSSLPEMTNQFEYSEFRNSAYAGITLNLKKIGFQSNVRYEYSENDINSEQKNSFGSWLPSANLQYKISPSHNVKLTFNRRINRPGIYDLNPFEKINNNLSRSRGNANLEPEYRNRLQFTYTANFGKNYCSPYFYYEHITDKIGIENRLFTDSITKVTSTLTTPQNMLTGYERGAGFNAMLWFININARYFKGHFYEFSGNATTQPIPARDYSSYSINGYAYAQFPKKAKITEFIFYNLNGVSINSQSKTYSMPIYGFGAQKEMGNHNFGFVYLLPFYKDIEFSKTITKTDNIYTDSRMGFDVSWFIQFMYTYKFNRGKTVKKVGHKASIESDSKSDGINTK